MLLNMNTIQFNSDTKPNTALFICFSIYILKLIGTITYQLQVQILIERLCFGSPLELDRMRVIILSYTNVDLFQLDTIGLDEQEALDSALFQKKRICNIS